MQAKEVIIMLISIVLLTSANPANFASTQKTFPPLSETQAYVNHLLSAYDALVQYNWENRPSFSNVQNFFLLYAPAGDTFNVIVMLAGPDDNGTVDMMFVLTGGRHHLSSTTPKTIYT